MIGLCTWIRTPDAGRVECLIVEVIYSTQTLFAQAGVCAVEGAPFNGCNYALVTLANVCPPSERAKAKLDKSAP